MIMQLSPVSIGKHTREQQTVSVSCMQGMVPQGPKEAAYGDDNGEQPLQVTKQNSNTKENVEL